MTTLGAWQPAPQDDDDAAACELDGADDEDGAALVPETEDAGPAELAVDNALLAMPLVAPGWLVPLAATLEELAGSGCDDGARDDGADEADVPVDDDRADVPACCALLLCVPLLPPLDDDDSPPPLSPEHPHHEAANNNATHLLEALCMARLVPCGTAKVQWDAGWTGDLQAGPPSTKVRPPTPCWSR